MDIDYPTYLMAFGYAITMGATEMRAHIFARNYGMPVDLDKVISDWQEFDKNLVAKEFWDNANAN